MRWEQFGALRKREFGLLFSASTVSRLGRAMASIAMAFGVRHLTNSVSDLGYVLAAGAVPFVAFVLIGGVWADRVSRLGVMALSGSFAGVSQGLTALLFLGGTARVWELMVLAAVQGTARAFDVPATRALIPETVTPARLQQATALLSMAASVTDIAGPAVAGLLVAVVGAGWVMLFNSATSFVEVGLRFRIRVDETARLSRERRPFRSEFAAGWQAVISRRWVWVMLIGGAGLALVVVAPWDVLGPALARSSLGGARSWGFIEAGYGLGAVAGGAVALHLRAGRPLLVAAMFNLLYVPVLVSFALVSPVAVIAAAAFVGGIANEGCIVLVDTTIQRLIPRDLLARVISFDWFSDAVTAPVALAVVGPIATRVGISAVFWAAAIAVVGITIAILMVADIRHLPRSHEQAKPSS